MSVKARAFNYLIRNLKGRTLVMLAMVLLCCLLWGIAEAEKVTVNYVDENGKIQSVEATKLTGSESAMTELESGWYVASGEVKYRNTIFLPGEETNIILADDAEMKIDTTSNSNIIYCIYGKQLSIYGQKNGTGKLTMNSNNWAIAVTPVNIYGGRVIADGGKDGIMTKVLTIKGGSVEATSRGYGCYGFEVDGGTITLGWRNPTDRIYADSYNYSTLNIADGQCFYNGSEILSGTIAVTEKNKVEEKTLTPFIAPVAKTGLVSNGQPQALLDLGSAVGGTFYYAVTATGSSEPAASLYSTSVPTATDAGTYDVWYKVIGDTTHDQTTPTRITVTISENKTNETNKTEKTTYVVALVDNGVHEIGDQKDCRITVRSEPDGSKAYDNYQNTRMDGAVMPNGSHTAEKGSLIVTLKAAYLDTLAIGKHKATINFKDGSMDVDITIKEDYVVPKTGDSANPVLWIGLMLMGLLTAGGIIVYMKKGNKRK